MNKPTLISINSEIMELARQREMILIGSEGEITEVNQSLISELEFRIKGLLTESKEKVTNYCSFLDSLDVEAAYCEQKIKEVQQYVKRLKSTQDWLLSTAKVVIDASGEPLAGNFGNKISLRKSTSVEVICDPDSLPEGFKRVKITVEADKTALKDAIKNGLVIDGVSLVEKSSATWK